MNKNPDVFKVTQIPDVELESLEIHTNYYMHIADIVKESGLNSIKKYIGDFDIHKVVLYGAGVVSRILCDMLEKDNVCEIAGVIDRDKSTAYGFHEFLSLDELQNIEYDMIIITPLGAVEAIQAELDRRGIEKYCFISEMADYDGIKQFAQSCTLSKVHAAKAGCEEKKTAAKMVYIVLTRHPLNPAGLGIRNKIKMQLEAFDNAGYEPIYILFDQYRIYIRECVGEKTLIKYGMTPHKLFDKLTEYIRQVNPEFIYLRYELIYKNWIDYFYRELGSLDIKTVCEFPTYPYDSEYDDKDPRICTDRYYRQNLKNYFKISTNFEDIDEIMGIPSIPIRNGISTAVPLHSVRNNRAAAEIHMLAVANLAWWHGYDRIIEGMNQYINIEKNSEWKIYFHIVGEGPESPRLQKMVEDYGLGENILFYGNIYDKDRLNAVFDGKDIGIGSIGMHRHTRSSRGSVIKTAEYCMRGLPFMIDYDDVSFDDNAPYILKVSRDENPVSMHEVIAFAGKYANIQTAQEMRDYATGNLTWDTYINKIIQSVQESDK